MHLVKCFYIAVFLSLPWCGFSQTRISQASGFWDDPSIWSGGIIPSSSNSTSIQILTGHSIIVRTACLVDELIIQGNLTVSSLGNLQILNGIGIDFSITGSVNVDGSIESFDGSSVVSNSANLFFNANSVYKHRHATQEGSIPIATWDAASSVEILGYTTASLSTNQGNWSQEFGNLIWDTPGLTVPFDLQGILNHIRGDLIIRSTGPQMLILSSLGTSDQLFIDGNFSIVGSSKVELTNSSNGNFYIVTQGNVTLNSTGILSMATNGIGSICVGRDLLILNGTVSESGTGTGEFLFNNSRKHQFRRGTSGVDGIFAGRINYRISVSDTLDLGNSIVSNGIGNSNTNVFFLSGTLMVGSTEITGAIQSNTTAGNLRTTVSERIFSSGSKIIYNGSSAQSMGNAGVAAGPGTSTIIDNIAGVNVVANVIVGSLVLKSGQLYINDTRSLTLSGDMVRATGFLNGSTTSTLIVSDSVSNNLNLSFSASPITLGNFTVERKADGASVTLLTPLAIISQLNLKGGDLINNGLLSLKNGAVLSRWPASRLVGQRIFNDAGERYNVTYRTSSISGGPFAKIITGLELPIDPNDLSILNITAAQSLDTVQLAQNVVVNDLLDMNRGRFYAQNFIIDFKGSVWSDDTGNFGYGTSQVIFSSSTTIQGTSNSLFHSVQVTPGSTLTFTRNTTIFGNLDFQPGSNVHASNITFTFSGGSPQSISPAGTTIGNITITKSNQSYIQLQSALNLKGLLRFNTPSSNIDFRSNGLLTLVSSTDTAATAFGNGMIYRLQNGNTVSGDVTVQRYLSGEGKIYRYISSPVNNGMVSSWKDDFAITGNFSDPSPATVICGTLVKPASPSFYFYDESITAGNHSGYIEYPFAGNSSTTSPLDVGRGYAAFMRQCSLPTLIDISGPINQQQISLPVTYTQGSTLQGWNLVGNPYPCTIDWDTGGSQGWIKTNISPVIAIRDNGAGGFFRYWDGDGVPADIPSGRIAPGQAFWVRTIAPNPILTIREGVKATQEAAFFREESKSLSVLTISLTKTNTSFTDKTYVKVNPGANSKMDAFDCPKLDNVLFDMSTLSDDSVQMAINAIDKLECNDSLKLQIADAETGLYEIKVEAVGEFEGFVFALKDDFLNKEIQLQGDSYAFEISSAEGSKAKDRFVIKWYPKLSTEAIEIPLEHTLCDDQSIRINVKESDPDTAYEIWEGENRISTSLEIHSSMFNVGMHRVRIKALKRCVSQFLENEVLIRRESPIITEVLTKPICSKGETTLLARSSDFSCRTLWYVSESSENHFHSDSVFQTPVLSKSTTYFVAAKTLRGCEGKKLPVIAEVICFDPVKVTLKEKEILISSYPFGNQWYLNNNELENDTSQYLFARHSGDYSVRNYFGPCKTEDRLSYKSTVIDGSFVFPNPVEDKFMIETDFKRVTNIELINSTGIVVSRFDSQAIEREKIGIFETTGLEPGLYFLRIVRTGRQDEILEIIKK